MNRVSITIQLPLSLCAVSTGIGIGSVAVLETDRNTANTVLVTLATV